ncbi:LysR family transcriptional regulator [Marinobacter daepoensis]|uniref:LysR family transcriptional regulator n=1 Tax=Marinobacter daepoensis TaxID=262077 RepID=A0ABS3BHX9_9GAMM|nr:LysR substrate-binding domain-containing protein [Marinobacter daepoensis]MBN7770511.1 LysR family transcriptional regulator [Marinobacter daepoensis]MBY6034718.1 LysR family transcriptional regulator [Marinobacter daepoensis]MBY6080453.1 LysR family transcriptional regulator [Marinobacter daepoensis]
MHTTITIDALKVLDAIDRKGSFAGAAGELFRVPSAISYTVQKLEEDLNVNVFDRSGHKAILTPAGRYLLEEGRSLLEAAENLAHTTRQVAQGWETRLRIGFNSLLPAECLFPAIKAFYQLGVPVDVQIVEEVFAGAWDALQSRRVDLVIGADQLSKPAGNFTTAALGKIPFVFAVAANHPLAKAEEPLTEADISRFPAAVAADTSRALPPGHAGIFRRQRTLTVTNIDQKIAIQEAGLGVGWLPLPRIQDALASGRLVARNVHEPRAPIAVHLARHSDAKGKALMWFWNRLSQEQALSQWLQPAPS